MKHVLTILLVLACLLPVGCSRTITLGKNDPPQPPLIIPEARLPEDMRFKNWVVNGEGSCAVASSCYVLSFLGHHEKAKWLRKNRGGGMTETSLRRIFDEMQLDYEYTNKGDPRFLEKMSADRRPCTIWWLSAHSCCFLGFQKGKELEYLGANLSPDKEYAVVWDNNRVSSFLIYDKSKFLTSWRSRYGGFAITFTDRRATPAAPLPWDFFRFIGESSY